MFQGVDKAGLTSATDPHVTVMASYDDPWTKEGRRDEVMLRRVGDKGEETWIGPWGML